METLTTLVSDSFLQLRFEVGHAHKGLTKTSEHIADLAGAKYWNDFISPLAFFGNYRMQLLYPSWPFNTSPWHQSQAWRCTPHRISKRLLARLLLSCSCFPPFFKFVELLFVRDALIFRARLSSHFHRFRFCLVEIDPRVTTVSIWRGGPAIYQLGSIWYTLVCK